MAQLHLITFGSSWIMLYCKVDASTER